MSPVKSKSQFRLFKAAEKGDVKLPGLSKAEAKEYTSENKDVKSLPEKVEKHSFKRVRQALRKK